MPSFIPISNAQELIDHQIDLKDLGKSTGFLGLGRKIYLVYDIHQQRWGVTSLHVGQRLLRFMFGYYQDTHKHTVKSHLDAHDFTQQLRPYPTLIKRIHDIWGMLPSMQSPFHSPKVLPETPSASPVLPQEHIKFIYDSHAHCFHYRDLRTKLQMAQLQSALLPADLKNIQRACLFGDWKEMDFNTESEAVTKGKDFTLLEKIVIELPELGDYAFLNIRGNGECGYRTIANGLLYTHCILQEKGDQLTQSIQEAFDRLIESWNTLPFDQPTDKQLFEVSKDQALAQLERMKRMDIPNRIALLQEENPFLAPFLSLIRCLTVSQTKSIEKEKIDKKLFIHLQQIQEILAQLRDQAHFTEEEEKHLSYALRNYPLEALLSKVELPDVPGNAAQNGMKDLLQQIVQQANQTNSSLLTELNKLIEQEHELSNQQNILTAPLAEMFEMGVSMDEFLKRKALANANSPRSLWAIGADFITIGYAFHQNICCIYRDPYRPNAFGIQKTFHNIPAAFYGLNLTGQVHYNALLPLISLR